VNQGILTQIQQPPAMPYQLLGRATPVPMPAVDYALDVDAADYIRRVEAADGQALELSVRLAIDTFVRGCKADGIWSALKASCIMAGARTLSGALVPLVGAAPTNFNFVSGDYSRKTGLVGDGSTKYLSSNRNNNADPQNSKHISVFVSNLSTVGFAIFGTEAGGIAGATQLSQNASIVACRLNSSSSPSHANAASAGFIGASRSVASMFSLRNGNVNSMLNALSESPSNRIIWLYARPVDTVLGATYINARLAFYSIGESLDLALLDARVSTLINAIGAALS
jgi:hypothetical protein